MSRLVSYPAVNPVSR